MYLIAIGWIYVVLLMSIAEATHTSGTVLGALITFFLYGALPLSLVLYIMRTPARKRAIKAREKTEAEAKAAQTITPSAPGAADAVDLDLPDARGHAPSAAAVNGVAAMRKEP
jgi:hypothetical protein